MGLLEYLITSIIIFIIPGEILRFDTQSSGFVLTDILTLLLFFYLLFCIIKDKKLPKLKLLWPGVFFIGTLSLSLIFSPLNITKEQTFISFLYLLRFISYFAIYLSFFYLNKDFIRNKIWKVLLFSVTTFLILGYLQILLYPDLRNLVYAGWDEHLNRFFGTFLDPNFTGSFLTLFFLYVLFLLLNKKYNHKFLWLILSVSFVAIFLTFSRSSYIMLASGVLVFLFLANRKKEMIAFIILFSLFLVIILNNKLFGEGTKLFRTASISARQVSANEAIDTFKKNPITGVGYNSYKFALQKYKSYENKSIKPRSAFGTDNSFLFILATSGIIGFTSFLYLVFQIMRLTVYQNKTQSIYFLSSIVVLGIGSLFNNLLFYPFIMIWYFILLGLTESK